MSVNCLCKREARWIYLRLDHHINVPLSTGPQISSGRPFSMEMEDDEWGNVRRRKRGGWMDNGVWWRVGCDRGGMMEEG